MLTKENFMNWEKLGAAVITGASSGIGEAYARALAEQGFELVLVARRKDKLEKLRSELEEKFSIKADVLAADLSDLSDIEQIYKILGEREDIDILINNAGFGTLGYFDLIPLEPSIEMLFVHNIAPVSFSRAVLPNMVKKGRGIIINVASFGAFFPSYQNVIYCATKAFLKMFTEGLAVELEDTGIKVQVLCPGFTKTEFHEVGYFKEFDRSVIPELAWMTSEEVVEISLKAFANNELIVVPGEANKKFLETITHPKFGEKLRKRSALITKIPRD
jgi:short-subunit dehydrogenase